MAIRWSPRATCGRSRARPGATRSALCARSRADRSCGIATVPTLTAALGRGRSTGPARRSELADGGLKSPDPLRAWAYAMSERDMVLYSLCCSRAPVWTSQIRRSTIEGIGFAAVHWTGPCVGRLSVVDKSVLLLHSLGFGKRPPPWVYRWEAVAITFRPGSGDVEESALSNKSKNDGSEQSRSNVTRQPFCHRRSSFERIYACRRGAPPEHRDCHTARYRRAH